MSKKKKNKKNKRVYNKSSKVTAKKKAKRAAKNAAKKAIKRAEQNAALNLKPEVTITVEQKDIPVAEASINPTCAAEETVSPKKKKIFGASIAIYAGVLLLLSICLWIVLWNKLSTYQTNYEAAKEAANPDLVIGNYLELFNRENIQDLVDGEWDSINSYETVSNTEDFIEENINDKGIRWERRKDFSDFRPRYDIFSDDNYIGAIALKQKSAVDDYGFHLCELDRAEIGFVPENLSSITIKAYDGTNVYVNDILLSDECIQKTPIADSMNAIAAEDTGCTYYISTYDLSGFFEYPSVRMERNGYVCEMDITDDADNHRTYEQTCMIDTDMLSEISDRALEIAKAYDYYAAGIREIGGMGQYFLHSGKGYRTLAGLAFDISIAGATTTYDILSADTGNLLVYSEDAVVIDTHQSIHRVHRRIEYDENIDVRWYLVRVGGRWYVKDFSMKL